MLVKYILFVLLSGDGVLCMNVHFFDEIHFPEPLVENDRMLVRTKYD